MAGALVLAGCGGGGNDAPAPPVATADTAEGVYAGTLSSASSPYGPSELSLVLENGDFYFIYGNKTATAFGVAGFMRGPSVSGLRGAFGATDMRDYAATRSGVTTFASGIYATGISLNVGIGGPTSTSLSASYTGPAVNDTTYAYSNHASLANIAGAWNLTDLAGTKVTLAVGADGKFSGTVGSCTISGTLAPRASGKNVFDFSLVYGAAPCAVPNQAISGAAIDYLIGTAHQFIAAGNDTTRATGIAFSGAR